VTREDQNVAKVRNRIEQRRQEREARAFVWQRVFAAVEQNPDADPNEIAAQVAVELEENAEKFGFDIGVLLQLLVTLLPLILQLFQRNR
jgi:hypothetical protein